MICIRTISLNFRGCGWGASLYFGGCGWGASLYFEGCGWSASLYFGGYGWGASISIDLNTYLDTYLQTSASAQTAPGQQTPRALLWTPWFENIRNRSVADIISSVLLPCYIVELSDTDGKLVRQGDGRAM